MPIECVYNWHNTGKQVFYDGSTFETLLAMYPVQFYDDFDAADLVIPASGADESGCKWTKKLVGAAPPTVATVADTPNGLVACALTADAQKQDAALHMDDQLSLSIAQGAIFETRLAMSVLPTLNGVASWGFWGAWGDGGSAYRVGFEAVAASPAAITCECDDNATDTSAASGVTCTAAQFRVYRIDCTTQSDIKFYIDGARVASGTTFNNAASAANSKCQPHIGMYKASGAGLGTIQVDYVKVYQNRS